MKKNNKGFTLIEMIVVIVILAVLMAVAVPSVLKYIHEADDAKYMTQARTVMNIAQTEFVKGLGGKGNLTEANHSKLFDPAIYDSGKNGMGIIKNIKIFAEGNVSVVNETIDISGVKALAVNQLNQQIKIIVFQLDDKYVVIDVNDEIYVTDFAPNITG